MAEKTDIWKVLEQCVLCDKALDWSSEPRLMPCLHSACGQCIDGNAIEMMKRISNGQLIADIHVFKCKPCNQVYNPLDCIENKLLFNHWSDIKPKTCQSCDQMREVVVKCVECNWICDQCVNAHNTYNALKQHNVLEKTRVKQLVRSETQHELSQKATELLDRIKEEKPLSDNSLQRLLSIEPELDRQMKECNESVDQSIRALHEKITRLGKEVKQKMDTIFTVKKNEFNDRRMRVKQLNDSLKFTEQFMSTIVKASDGQVIAEIEDMITKRINDLINQCSASKAGYQELLSKIEVKVNNEILLKSIEIDVDNQDDNLDATIHPQYVELKDQGTMVDVDLWAGYRQLRKSPRSIKSEYSCDKPGCNFRTNAAFQWTIDEHELAHEQGHPNPKKKKKVIGNKNARVVCDWPGCNKIFRQYYLQEHINGVHRQVKPYICPLTDCPFASAYKGSLQDHLRYVHAQMTM